MHSEIALVPAVNAARHVGVNSNSDRTTKEVEATRRENPMESREY